MKSIVITGAGSGLGKDLVEVFTEKGWNVIGTTRKELDLTLQSSIDNFLETLKDQSVDVLINCAGLYDAPPDDEKVVGTVPEISKVFAVNTIGPKVLTDRLVENLMKGEDKLVVTISSQMGLSNLMDEYNANHWSYSASKTAVNFAMIAFSEQHPEIKSVLIHPGWVKSKIGGAEADLEPEFVAEKIYDLIQNPSKLPINQLIDYEGKLLEK